MPFQFPRAQGQIQAPRQQGQAPNGQQPAQQGQPPRGQQPRQQAARQTMQAQPDAFQKAFGNAIRPDNSGAGHTLPFGNVQQAPQPAPELYTVLDAKVQGGMSGSNTLVYLETPQKKQLYAYVRGVRQELTRGTQLCNVKLKTQKQDTVAFYVLEAYEIYQQVQQAA